MLLETGKLHEYLINIRKTLLTLSLTHQLHFCDMTYFSVILGSLKLSNLTAISLSLSWRPLIHIPGRAKFVSSELNLCLSLPYVTAHICHQQITLVITACCHCCNHISCDTTCLNIPIWPHTVLQLSKVSLKCMNNVIYWCNTNNYPMSHCCDRCYFSQPAGQKQRWVVQPKLLLH